MQTTTKHTTKKVGKGVYEYRGVIISKDVRSETLPWDTRVAGKFRSFATLIQAREAIDKALETAAK